MLYLSEIRTVNIKSHKDIYIMIPPKGIVRFKGGNNDGKSVIPDCLKEVIGCTLNNRRRRLPLINYDVDEGYITLKRSDGAILHVTINKESAKTFYRLKLPGCEDVITRYIADKGLRELVTLFGFHWDEKREMSLNLYNTYDSLLFVNTSEAYNHDILTSVVTDTVAESAKEQIEAVKKQFEVGYKALVTRVSNRESEIAAMKFYDESKLNDKAMKLRDLARCLNNLATHSVLDLKRIPDITMLENLDTVRVKTILKEYIPIEVPKYNDIELLFNLPTLSCARKAYIDYDNAKSHYDNGECFACGRRYKRGRKKSNDIT